MKAILCDLDGTLADTAPDLGTALNRLLEEQNRETLAAHTIRKHASFGAKGLVHCAFGDCPPAQEARLTQRFLELYEQNLCAQTQLFDGVPETLNALSANGLAWGVVTNKSRRFAEPILQQLGLHDHADCLIYGDSAKHRKPAPDLLLAATEALQVAAGDCLYIGDSRRDADAAKAAGMPVLVVAYGYESRDTDTGAWNIDGVLKTFGDLLPYCQTRQQCALN